MNIEGKQEAASGVKPTELAKIAAGANLQPAVSNVTVVASTSPTEDIKKILGECTKYTVLAVFGLYSIGFVIWHSYLATFGVSSVGFLQTEYLSAALCYLLLIACFATPPAILIERWKKGDKTHKISYLIYLWYLCITQIVGRFFPEKAQSPFIMRYAFGGFAVLVLYIVGMLVCKKKWGSTKAYKRISDFDIYSTWLTGYVFLYLFSNSEIDRIFVGYSLILYLLLIHYTGKDVRKVWSESGYKVRFLLLCLMLLVGLSNVQLFGSVQFGKIPRTVGGGKPDVAYIKLGPAHADLAYALKLVPNSSGTNADGFIGPLEILLRTEREIIFFDIGGAPAPPYSQNQALTNASTNILSATVTNLSSGVFVSNGPGGGITNPGFGVSIITNASSATKSAIAKPGRKSAKEIRSDAVDAIIFSE